MHWRSICRCIIEMTQKKPTKAYQWGPGGDRGRMSRKERKADMAMVALPVATTRVAIGGIVVGTMVTTLIDTAEPALSSQTLTSRVDSVNMD